MNDKIPAFPVGRLAPSPTGAQHVGNARTYLIAWLSARGGGGRVVLRVEDIDSPRVKTGAAAAGAAGTRTVSAPLPSLGAVLMGVHSAPR